MKLSKSLYIGFCAALLATAGIENVFADYKQAPSPLMTEWGESMTPETAWTFYPRPNMVRDNWSNLNGMWDYAITKKNQAQKPEKWDGQILVPFAVESALSGVGRRLDPNEVIWYHRTLNVDDLGGERMLLHFDAIDFRAQVFVNGKEVTDFPHESSILPFAVDITDAVKTGTNDLLVYIWDPTDTWQNATGKQVLKPGGIMYTATSGIWQSVWTEKVPATHITGYNFEGDVDNGYAYITLKTVGNLMGADAQITVKDADGKNIASGKVTDWTKPVELRISDPKLWSPESPYLYDFEVKLNSKSGTDKIKGYFGMRKIEMRKDQFGAQSFFLNNKKVYMLGTLDQGWWPDGLLTPPSAEAMMYDIKFLKDAGFNMMRKHIKREPLYYYYLCDKMGIMLWQDMASGPGDVNTRYGMYRKELKGMIDYLQPIPSIVVWVPYNEGWGEPEAFKANATLSWVMDYDKTRLVDGPSGWTDYGTGSMKDMHNYPGPGMFDLMPNRISVLGEFGGLGFAVKDHVWAANKGWGYVSDQDQAASFERYSSLMSRLNVLAARGLAASVYTQTTDCEVEINGLLTYDRKVDKYGRENLKKLHDKVYEYAEKSLKSQVIVPAEQEWKYTFEQPADDWFKADFDCSSWETGKAGFGNDVIVKDNANAKVNTKWDTSSIWMKRDFNLDQDIDLDTVMMNIFFDEDPEIYLNGVKIASYEKWNGNYVDMPIDLATFKKALKKGKNSLSVHCTNKTGGAYIDFSIVAITTAK